MLYINDNSASQIAQMSLYNSTFSLNKSLERLSTGYQINHASDNPAGLEIVNNLMAQSNGINQAISNAQDGNNVLSTADGTLSSVQDNLQRIRELTVQAANDTNGTVDRSAIKQEIDSRVSEINRAVAATQFNGKNILQGAQSSFRIQVGPNGSKANDTINVGSAFGSATATHFGLVTSGNEVASNSNASAFLSSIDTAISAVSSRRATVGSYQDQLTSAVSNLQVASINMQSSVSTIRDVNVAQETANLTQNQILQQATLSVLAQANQQSSILLKLLG